MVSISGTVVRYGSAERIANASVKATDSKGKITQIVTDDDGDFTFTKLEPGKWSIVALHEESYPNVPVEVDVSSDVENIQIKLQRLAGQVDEVVGMQFFKSLLIGFGALIVVYIVLHIIFPMKEATSTEAFFWDKNPWRYIEIIAWALAGVLINKIITCGWFLRNQKFYREGIIMHISHLVATPLMVLVAVLILSLASLKLTLTGGTEVTLDLSLLPILIAVSFLLGTSPWPVWNFIEDAAKKIVGPKLEKE